MKKRKKWYFHIGLPMILLGCGMVAVGYPTGMNDRNWYLLVCLLTVTAGTVLHVMGKKRESNY